jgi:hypothetical protein
LTDQTCNGRNSLISFGKGLGPILVKEGEEEEEEDDEKEYLCL